MCPSSLNSEFPLLWERAEGRTDTQTPALANPLAKQPCPDPLSYSCSYFPQVQDTSRSSRWRLSCYILWKIMGFKIFDDYIKLIFDSLPSQRSPSMRQLYPTCSSRYSGSQSETGTHYSDHAAYSMCSGPSST